MQDCKVQYEPQSLHHVILNAQNRVLGPWVQKENYSRPEEQKKLELY
jgi:hypothetical protein